MTFEPYEPRMGPLIFFQIGLAIFGLIITIMVLMKWRERKTLPILYLSLVFACLTLAVISQTIGMLEALITGYKMYIYRIMLPLAYTFIVLADIFLFLFATQFIDKGKRLFVPFLIIGIALVIILFLPMNYYGQPPEDYAGKLSIRLYSMLVLVLYSCIIYMIIATLSLKTRKISEDKIVRIGLLLLVYSMISMLCFFLMLVGENVMIVVFDHPGYSIFMYIAWLFALLFIILAYISAEMPGWLKKWINKKYASEMR